MQKVGEQSGSTVGDRAEIMLFGDSPETFSFVLGQV